MCPENSKLRKLLGKNKLKEKKKDPLQKNNHKTKDQVLEQQALKRHSIKKALK